MLAHDHEKRPERDTITALSTPPGRGAIAIVRLSGLQTGRVLRRIFLPKNKTENFLDRKFVFGRFVGADGEPFDEGMVVFMAGPRSYTGEDMAELYCHGGPAIVRALLSAAVDSGARPAAPGEFTRRAFLEGKIDLVQSESVADLISAETKRAAKAALSHLEGGLSSVLEGIWEKIVEVGAHLEAAIDFPDEFEPGAGPTLTGGPVSGEELSERFSVISAELKKLEESFITGQILREGARVAILGRPNSGKSTLLNRLLGADRAIISSIPGTTRDTVEDVCDIGGIPLRLIDTAGLRETEDPVEREGARRARRAAADADLRLVLMDATAGLEEATWVVAELKNLEPPSILLANKIDLHQATIPEDLPENSEVLRISALTGEGIDALREAITSCLLGDGQEKSQGDQRLLTRERHRDLVVKCYQAIEKANFMSKKEVSPELVAVELNVAQRALSELLGRDYGEALLDKIFSTFCIGK
jgi:tRNA modification GTPase